MFNISKGTMIINLPEKLTINHLEACLNDKNLHDKPHYMYLGKHVSKGTIILYTTIGPIELKFYEKNGWAETIEIIKV